MANNSAAQRALDAYRARQRRPSQPAADLRHSFEVINTAGTGEVLAPQCFGRIGNLIHLLHCWSICVLSIYGRNKKDADKQDWHLLVLARPHRHCRLRSSQRQALGVFLNLFTITTKTSWWAG